MAAPNIVNTATITGLTTTTRLTNTNQFTLLSNASGSGKVYKLNTILATNITGTTLAISVNYHEASAGVGTFSQLAGYMNVPAKSSLIVVSKDSSIYLEENRSISVQSDTANACHIFCSYDEFS